jgi:hypothetical protein
MRKGREENKEKSFFPKPLYIAFTHIERKARRRHTMK